MVARWPRAGPPVVLASVDFCAFEQASVAHSRVDDHHPVGMTIARVGSAIIVHFKVHKSCRFKGTQISRITTSRERGIY